ncbi:hypothetical protein ENBRE01_0422 [Enteropsectra breve]|nr:hypothetical protein ENBRE01_0422 [Enteropsectra breve]
MQTKTIRKIGEMLLKSLCLSIFPSLIPRELKLKEAEKILDLGSQDDTHTAKSKFEKLYKINSIKNGGSQYVQQAIQNAFLSLKRNKFIVRQK